MLPLTGYCDPLSAAPGEVIAFKVGSARPGRYDARLVRVVCGDPNPAGPGLIEHPVPASFAGSHPARVQPVHPGSYGVIAPTPALAPRGSFTVLATIWPTTPDRPGQGLVTMWDQCSGSGFALSLDGAQGVTASLGAGAAGSCRVHAGEPLRSRTWYHVWMSYDAAAGRLSVGQAPAHPRSTRDRPRLASCPAPAGHAPSGGSLCLAAAGGDPVGGHFNGKLERPAVLGRALDAAAVTAVADGGAAPEPIAVWDFARDIGSQRIVDTGPNALHGRLVNLPARAMTGAGWTGREMCWRHAPAEYGAIHFHDDDVGDCGWETDFTFRIPADLPSGVYAARLRQDDVEDMIPFFVRPPAGSPTAPICVLFPTFTYIAYGNYARPTVDSGYRERVAAWGASPWTPNDHPDYGLSTYNTHTDGSGIGYATRLRPLLNMRSAYLQFVDAKGSGMRHFPADTHLIAWLHAKGFAYDVVTDEDLEREGSALLAPYRVVLATTHPEYHTETTLTALHDYAHRSGGKLMYLGGNGFYWRIATSPELPGAIELRRAEGGIRTWAAEPGEYYHAFDGAYGGLWRRNGRPPQALCGVGFTAQGPFTASHYRRSAAAGPAADWVFDGVEGPIIGDFGLSAGGAAGYELDRADPQLGTPEDATVLATSEGHAADYALVPEEMLTHIATVSGGSIRDQIRADMVHFDTPSGGAVFAVGSITFCGSLPHNGFDNNVSRIVENVLRRFRDEPSPAAQAHGCDSPAPASEPTTGGVE